eukprot:scaffold93556_cov57-Attheya_sp.AAC.2
MRASLIHFDVKNDDLANLEQLDPDLDLHDGDEWTTFTGECLTEGGEDPYSVWGCAEAVVLYAFRTQAGDCLLLGDTEKMGVALFDVFLDDAEGEDIIQPTTN